MDPMGYNWWYLGIDYGPMVTISVLQSVFSLRCSGFTMFHPPLHKNFTTDQGPVHQPGPKNPGMPDTKLFLPLFFLEKCRGKSTDLVAPQFEVRWKKPMSSRYNLYHLVMTNIAMEKHNV